MKVRYTENSFANARVEATDRREKIENTETWLAGFDKSFWKGVTERIQARLATLQMERDTQLDKMTESALRANVACDRELRELLLLPLRAQHDLAEMKLGYQEILEFMNANRDKAS